MILSQSTTGLWLKIENWLIVLMGKLDLIYTAKFRKPLQRT